MESLEVIASSFIGFTTVISILIYNQRQNDTRIRALCEKVARLEERIKMLK
jgi:hypothetical protein